MVFNRVSLAEYKSASAVAAASGVARRRGGEAAVAPARRGSSPLDGVEEPEDALLNLLGLLHSLARCLGLGQRHVRL
eukprot:4487450-Prymnesium_polylepis.1